MQHRPTRESGPHLSLPLTDIRTLGYAGPQSAEEGRGDTNTQRERRKKMKTRLIASALVFVTLAIVGIGPAFATGSFSLTGNPPSCEDYIVPGGCAQLKITVASVNGFSGTVNLSAVVTSGPSGLTPKLNPTSLSVPSGGNANSTFTVTATCTQFPYCSWGLNITGTSGTLSSTISDIAVCRPHGGLCPV